MYYKEYIPQQNKIIFLVLFNHYIVCHSMKKKKINKTLLLTQSQTIDCALILLISVTDLIKFWSWVNWDPNMTSLCLSQTPSEYNNIKLW